MDNTSFESRTATVDGVEEVTEWVDNGGRPFYIHTFKPTTQPPVATVTLVHGLGEHIGRYGELGQNFAHAGIQTIGFDQRGFGKTGRRSGCLGHNEGIDTVADDIAFINSRATIDGVPHFLFGHSMGGLNVLNYAARKNQNTHVSGVIASAPALQPGKLVQRSRVTEFLFHLITHVAPKTRIDYSSYIDKQGGNDSKLKNTNESDDGIEFCTMGTISTIVKRGPELIQSAPSFNTPVLLVHADGDQITNPNGTRSFYLRLPDTLDKEFKVLKGVKCHELDIEDLGFSLWDIYIKWILDRAK
ncbi:hypothetical protein IW140_000801 [Coemansia sp. RSA 1813]|nr:hypothetical protein LPJ74_004679 [Coemansia sp. RSA 1843]KAJ2093343.1 hypothetical protein IW138_000193 [Coemansia sp. RSA 986]KAJ2217152.1 hypothetical protein EV179_000619 [Coemansia sp. RSA 487]KAJ2572350.1 hypothetical protein IW140_000801 [Coemansia sp. RSA 1813]